MKAAIASTLALTDTATRTHVEKPAKAWWRRGGGLGKGLGVGTRLRLVLFGLLIPPPAIILYLLESRAGLQAGQLVALWLAVGLIALKPVANLAAKWVAVDEINSLNAFCAALRRGEYAKRLPLPPQGEDEHALTRLKRDLNWLAHHVETRETWLTAMLDEAHRSKCRFEDLSRTDALTGLFNRRHFETVLPECLAWAQSRHTGLALLLIDCDAFKTVNDRYGHPVGDTVLVAMGRALGESIREALDMAFRLGGDEFAVILPHQDAMGASVVAKRLRGRFAAVNHYAVTASIGLACLDPTLDTTDPAASLVARCDAALYRAKAGGGNRLAWAEGLAPAIIENEN